MNTEAGNIAHITATHLDAKGQFVDKPREEYRPPEKKGIGERLIGLVRWGKKEVEKPDGSTRVFESIRERQMGSTLETAERIARKENLTVLQAIPVDRMAVKPEVPAKLADLLQRIHTAVGQQDAPIAIKSVGLFGGMSITTESGVSIGLRVPYYPNDQFSFSINASALGESEALTQQIQQIQQSQPNELFDLGDECTAYALAVTQQAAKERQSSGSNHEVKKPTEKARVYDTATDEVRDELPEVSVNSVQELTDFLARYRHALNSVARRDLGWDDDMRCGVTSLLVMRALYDKPHIVGLQQIGVDRLGSDYGMGVAESVLADVAKIAKETGVAPTAVETAIRDMGETAATVYLDRQRTNPNASLEDADAQADMNERITHSLQDQPPELIAAVKSYLSGLLENNPDAIENAIRFLSTGVGHQVVLVETQFDPNQPPERFIVDANAEQFGQEFDKLYVVPLDQATEQKYLLRSPSIDSKKIGADALKGEITRYKSGSSRYGFDEGEPINVAEVSHMIAERYRNLNPTAR